MDATQLNLHELAELIEEECRRAREHGVFGTDDFHIERADRLPDREGALCFRVTTWNEQSEHPRRAREMSLFDLMNLLGRVIGHRAVNAAVDKIAGAK
jgi:hypothetical protein